MSGTYLPAYERQLFDEIEARFGRLHNIFRAAQRETRDWGHIGEAGRLPST